MHEKILRARLWRKKGKRNPTQKVKLSTLSIVRAVKVEIEYLEILGFRCKAERISISDGVCFLTKVD